MLSTRILSADAIAHSVPSPRPRTDTHDGAKEPGPNVKKFGMPLYASAWLDERTLVVAGGGGKKSSGIPNRMCVATFDGVTLSEPLFSCHTDETAPQGLIPTPDKTRLLCVFSGDVALYDVAPNPDPPDTLGDTEESDPPRPPARRRAVHDRPLGPHRRRRRPSHHSRRLRHQVRGVQLGRRAARRRSRGRPRPAVRVATRHREGPPHRSRRHARSAHRRRHRHRVLPRRYPNPHHLRRVRVQARSGAAVWSVAEKIRVRALSDPSVPAAAGGASYRFAAFGPAGSNSAYTCLNIGGEGYATRWNTRDWTVISRRRVGKDPVTAAALSPDGGCLVAGDSEGRVVILDAATFATRSVEKDAHMIFVTTVACNDDGTAALSGSADASACARDARRSGAAGSVARVIFAVFACLALAWLFVFVGSRAAFLSASAARGAEGGEPEGVNLLDGVDLGYAKEVAELARMATARAAHGDRARGRGGDRARGGEAARRDAAPQWEDYDEVWDVDAAGFREEEDEGVESAEDEGVDSAEDEREHVHEDRGVEGDDEDDDEDEVRDGNEDAFEDEEDAPTVSREEL